MEQQEIPITTDKHDAAEQSIRPALALEIEDVGNLDEVLRGYYLSQIKSIEKRKDRKLARRLLEDHLVLPKSRQRTSKDAAYIKEVLDVDYGLLENLEDSRLIRRIHKSGNNPIYEVSHDTLVEPILSEKKDREAIARFIKKSWKYLALLLLLWFLFGMLFENTFEVIPPLADQSKSAKYTARELAFNVGNKASSFRVQLPPIIIDEELKPSDSILIELPLDLIPISSLTGDGATNADTISIKLTSPLEVPLDTEERPVTYQTFSDVVVPLAYQGREAGDQDADSKQIFAKISGNLKMTSDVLTAKGVSEYDSRLETIEMNLGDTLLQANKSTQSVPVNFSLRLTDFFQDENDRNRIRNTVGDREVQMNYTVQVRPSQLSAPPPKIEYPSVQGIEVQYSDGTSRFIPGDANAGATEKTHTVVSGETLFSIAKKYGLVDAEGNTSTLALKQLNNLQNNTLRSGQVLRIPDL